MTRSVLLLMALAFPLIGRSQGAIEFSANLTRTWPDQPPLHEVVNFVLEGNNLRGSILEAEPRLSNVYVTFGPSLPSYHFQNLLNDGNWLYGGALWDEELLSLFQGKAYVSGVVVVGSPPLAYSTDVSFLAVPEPSSALLCGVGAFFFGIRKSGIQLKRHQQGRR